MYNMFRFAAAALQFFVNRFPKTHVVYFTTDGTRSNLVTSASPRAITICVMHILDDNPEILHTLLAPLINTNPTVFTQPQGDA